MYHIKELNALKKEELEAIARKQNLIKAGEVVEKEDIIYKILTEQSQKEAKEMSEKGKKPKNIRNNKKESNFKKGKHNNNGNNNKPKKAPHNKKPNNTPTGEKAKNTTGYKNPLEELTGLIEAEGVLDLMPEGYGFLRSSDYNYLSSPDDIYVSHQVIRTWNLKKGHLVYGKLRPPKKEEKYFSLAEIIHVNGRPIEELRKTIDFKYLTPIFPNEKFKLSHSPNKYGSRIMDLFIPIGKGQRAMIVAPPKAGKTILLKDITNGISQNHPEVYLIVLMIGERPEEVTDMRRSVNAEVVASTFDEPHENHIKVASVTIEKAKRMVECGHDVVLILDSLTRLARAYNLATPSSGKVLSGGVDVNALHTPKRFFGAARNIENGGSLSIIASALIETGSKMEEVILEEFTGTGNTELRLNRNLAAKSLFPAIDIKRSSTRRGEDLQPPEQLKYINMLRRLMMDMNNSEEALKFLLENIKGTSNNEEFLASTNY